MSFELALKKAGLPLVRSFMHSIEGIQPALPAIMNKRSIINFKFKQYKDGKMLNQKVIQTIEESFPCKGDKK